mmetsp:Transcript_79336/g.220694  ORF Transcript_79336/g.220694 Transcript_79336/m.220694 type:complete len:286 (+) Transcript_79336:324-1181(+)
MGEATAPQSMPMPTRRSAVSLRPHTKAKLQAPLAMAPPTTETPPQVKAALALNRRSARIELASKFSAARRPKVLAWDSSRASELDKTPSATARSMSAAAVASMLTLRKRVGLGSRWEVEPIRGTPSAAEISSCTLACGADASLSRICATTPSRYLFTICRSGTPPHTDEYCHTTRSIGETRAEKNAPMLVISSTLTPVSANASAAKKHKANAVESRTAQAIPQLRLKQSVANMANATTMLNVETMPPRSAVVSSSSAINGDAIHARPVCTNDVSRTSLALFRRPT